MQARKLGIAYSWMWLKQGIWLFKKNPFIWMTLTSALVIGMLGILMFPFVGELLAPVFFPGFFAGLMLGCHDLAEEKPLELKHFFAGFQQHGPQLISLGVISMIISQLLVNMLFLAGGETMAKQLEAAMRAGSAEAVMQAFSQAGVVFPTFVVLSLVLQSAVLLAAMLIVFRGARPLAALLAALRATLVNALPLLAYGVILFPFAILATALLVGWLVLLPIEIASQYAIYRDMFPMQKDLQAAAEDAAKPDDQPPPA